MLTSSTVVSPPSFLFLLFILLGVLLLLVLSTSPFAVLNQRTLVLPSSGGDVLVPVVEDVPMRLHSHRLVYLWSLPLLKAPHFLIPPSTPPSGDMVGHSCPLNAPKGIWSDPFFLLLLLPPLSQAPPLVCWLHSSLGPPAQRQRSAATSAVVQCLTTASAADPLNPAEAQRPVRETPMASHAEHGRHQVSPSLGGACLHLLQVIHERLL